MQRNFVVAIDFASSSFRAYRLARSYAKHYGCTLHLIHVVEYPGRFSGLERRMVYEATAKEEAMERFRKLEKEAEEAGLPPFHWSVATGEPVRRINELVAELEAIMVFMGRRGDRNTEDVYIGTKTLSMLRACDVPVMVVEDVPDELEGPRYALLPVSRKYGIRGILQWITDCPIPFKPPMDLLTALDEEGSEPQVVRFLERKVKDLETLGIAVGQAEIVDGEDVSDSIVAYINSVARPIDLVMMENRNHAAFGELTVGSSIEEIVVGCPRPVLCVRSLQSIEEPD